MNVFYFPRVVSFVNSTLSILLYYVLSIRM